MLATYNEGNKGSTDNRSFMDKFRPRDQHKVFDVLSFKLPRIDSNLSCSTSALSQCEWSAIFVNSVCSVKESGQINSLRGSQEISPFDVNYQAGEGGKGVSLCKRPGGNCKKSVNVGSK